MIQKLFTDQTVAVDIEVKNWEEAVRYGGKMLVDAGNTDRKYIDAMVKNIQKMGQYIVIAPGLAMPHARPEYGVKKIGMSLVRLKNPVPFGNEEYDPVDILIFICAIDQTTHITALAELMVLIEDEKFLAAMRNGMKKGEIVSYIQNKDFTVKDD
jgi:PTS system ascorbate-specific IIA component